MPKFPKYAWGDLNPLTQKRFGARFDQQVSTFESAQQTIHDKHYYSDALSKRTEFVGLVLRVEQRSGGEPGDFLSTSDNPNTVIAKSRRVRIKVRVPEIHASIPEPSDFRDHFVIDMHPTFTAINHRLPTPRIGDRVLVGYNDPENLSDPVYKQYIEKTSTRLNLGTRRNRRKCLEQQDGTGCLEPKSSGNSKIDVTGFPAPRGSLVPKTTSSTAFLFGDSQMQGNFGEVFEKYLKHHGWNVKRFARSGSGIQHWRSPGKRKTGEKDWLLKGYIDDALKANPQLIIISLGGNNNGITSSLKTGIHDLVKQCLSSGGDPTVIWSGAPPPVKNKKRALKIFKKEVNNWDEKGAFSYREKTNRDIKSVLDAKFADQLDKKLFFINPIGDAPGYSEKEKYLPSYKSPGRDGIHLTAAAASEYVQNIIEKGVGNFKSTATSPAPGASPPVSPGMSISPAQALLAAKEELKAEKSLPEADQDKDKIKKLEAEVEKYEKMPKAITAATREKYIQELMEIEDKVANATSELSASTDAARRQELMVQIDNLELEKKHIEQLLDDDDKASKPVPCNPCDPSGNNNLGPIHETDSLALNYSDAKAKGWANGQNKYLRAFLRMISIGEGGRKARGGISPYNLIVGGDFVGLLNHAGNGILETDPNNVAHWGGKNPGGYGNYTSDLTVGHPRIRVRWSDSGSTSPAAGRYQFMVPTWNRWVIRHHPEKKDDFSAINQDMVVLNYLNSLGIKKLLEEGGANFVTPSYLGSKDINKGRDTRPSSVASIVYKDRRKKKPTFGQVLKVVRPTNKFEEQFYMAVDKVRATWASLPGSPYSGQKTKRPGSDFLDWYKVALAEEIELEKAASPKPAAAFVGPPAPGTAATAA